MRHARPRRAGPRCGRGARPTDAPRRTRAPPRGARARRARARALSAAQSAPRSSGSSTTSASSGAPSSSAAPARRARHDRHARRARLEDDVAERLLPRRHARDVGRREHRLDVVARAGHDGAPVSAAASRRQPAEPLVVADQHQHGVRAAAPPATGAAGGRTPCAGSRCRCRRRPRAPGGMPSARRAGGPSVGPVPRMEALEVDAVVDDGDALGRDAVVAARSRRPRARDTVSTRRDAANAAPLEPEDGAMVRPAPARPAAPPPPWPRGSSGACRRRRAARPAGACARSPTTTSKRSRATARGAATANDRRRAHPARPHGRHAVHGRRRAAARSAARVKTWTSWPRAASPPAVRRRSASVPPPARLRCMNAIRITRHARAPGARATARAGGTRGSPDRSARASASAARAPAASPASAARAREAGASAAPGAARTCAGPTSAQHLGMLARELVGEADRLLAHGARGRGDAGGVAPVCERRHVEEDRRAARATPAAPGRGRRGCGSSRRTAPARSSARRVKHIPWSCPRFQRKTSAKPSVRPTSVRATSGAIQGASRAAGVALGGEHDAVLDDEVDVGMRRAGTRRAATSRPGSAMSSESWNATSGARAAATPALRAAAMPPCGRMTGRTRGSGCAASSAAVPSVEPSSTTTTSNATPSCASRLSRLAPSSAARW